MASADGETNAVAASGKQKATKITGLLLILSIILRVGLVAGVWCWGTGNWWRLHVLLYVSILYLSWCQLPWSFVVASGHRWIGQFLTRDSLLERTLVRLQSQRPTTATTNDTITP